MGIKTTGNSRIDTATAEIAVLIRDARVGLPRYREQDHYDEAVRLRDEIMAGARELAALPPWRPASNGSGSRRWFLIRGWGTESDAVPLAERYHYDRAGQLVRYATIEVADCAADKLNRQGDK